MPNHDSSQMRPLLSSEAERSAADADGQAVSTTQAASVSGLLTRRDCLRMLAGGALLAGCLAGGEKDAMAQRQRPGQNRNRPGNGQGRKKGSGQGAQPAGAQPPALLDQTIKKFMSDTGTPGMAVVVYDGGQENIYCWGDARTDQAAPVTPDTVFGIGSVTKVFTCTLLAWRVGASGGKYKLDDPVINHLPAAQTQRKDIGKVTLKMLATHTSGFPENGASGKELFQDKPPSSDMLAWWQNWTAKPPSAIGTKYNYSNIGMTTLGYAVAGNDYNTLLQSKLCGPLGMGHTAPAAFLPADSVTAQGHLTQGGKVVGISTQNSDLNSSPRDMLLFLKAQLGAGRVPPALSRAIALSHQPQFTPPSGVGGPIMGLGWQISKGATKIYSKDGGTTEGGCACWIGCAPDASRKFGIVVFGNLFGTGKSANQSLSGMGMSLLQQLSGISPT